MKGCHLLLALQISEHKVVKTDGIKVKGWHQMKDCLKSELPKLYAHHLSCYQ